MPHRHSAVLRAPAAIPKAPTGIRGFDEITVGGLPRGRPALVCGAAGSGKTLFGVEFLARGAMQFDEPGAIMAFEESPEEIARNVASLGFDLDGLIRRRKLAVDYVRIDRHEVEGTGEYDLEALFLRLGLAIDSVGAKRVLIDTLEVLFAALPNEFILRSELRRLFRWLKERGVTAVITAERGAGALTRHGLEEYVSDCVILLDNRVVQQAAIRRLRIVKYRGSAHGTSEYPFLIGEGGFSVLPLSSISLEHPASRERQSLGIAGLDEMLEGKGLFKGSTALISGTAGTGKSSLSAHFADAVCAAGRRCLYFAFEEGARQIIRNMSSIGLDLGKWVDSGRLVFQAGRPTEHGLETHLAMIHKLVAEHEPAAVIIDPITNFEMSGSEFEVKAMVMRLVDFLKRREITCVFTSLTGPGSALEGTAVGISSLVDTWLLVRDVEAGGERNRLLHVLKSRGMAHSNRLRELVITSKGIRLVDVGLGPEGVLAGSARLRDEARERESAGASGRHTLASLERQRRAVERQIRALEEKPGAQERGAGRAPADAAARTKHAADDRAMPAGRRTNGGKTAR